MVQHKFKVFLALTLNMGIVRKSRVDSYWGLDETVHTPFFGKYMAYNRYYLLYNNFHLVNNDSAVTDVNSPAYDALYKIRPLITHLRNKFIEVYTPVDCCICSILAVTHQQW